MRTYSAKPADVSRKWYVLDASKTTLGRLSTQAASLLLGKGKPQITAHIDCGDYVIIVNAKDLTVTGNKMTQKRYYRHSGYPGALKERTLADQMAADPSEVVLQSVRGMLPVNKLRDGRLARLKIYAGSEHNHAAQQPEILAIKEEK
jgi:large subunit ribosomal protein L13